MSWYYIDLGNREIDKLNTLFSSSYYDLEKSTVSRNMRSEYIKDDERKIFQSYCILSYSKENMATYPAMVEQLPNEIQIDIKNRIQQVKGFEEVVRDLDDVYFR